MNPGVNPVSKNGVWIPTRERCYERPTSSSWEISDKFMIFQGEEVLIKKRGRMRRKGKREREKGKRKII